MVASATTMAIEQSAAAAASSLCKGAVEKQAKWREKCRFFTADWTTIMQAQQQSSGSTHCDIVPG